jgi:hypothetical protein
VLSPPSGKFFGEMSVSAGTTRIVAMEGHLNSSSFDMDQRDPNNLNNHLQVCYLDYYY